MRSRIAVALVMGLLLGLVVGPAPALAHSFLQDAKPGIDSVVQRGPKRVVLYFDEPVEVQFATIAVYTRDGRRVRASDPEPTKGTADGLVVRLPRRLARGRYVVRWRVVSADSHIESGEYGFRVKRPAEQDREPDQGAVTGPDGGTGEGPTRDVAAPAADVGDVDDPTHATTLVSAARGVTMAGLLLLVGLVVFWLLAWGGVGAGLAPPTDVQTAFVRRWQRMASVAVVITVVATIAGVLLQGAAAANTPLAGALRLDVIEGVLATGFGKAAVGRIVLLEMLAVLAVLWRTLPLLPEIRPKRAVGAAALSAVVSGGRLVLLAVVVLPLLLTMSMVSHAAGASPAGLHLVVDALHLGAAGAWVGGILVLSLAAFPATAALAPAERVQVLGPAVVRFSRIAGVSVVIVIATGIIRGLDTVGGPAGLTGSAYGTALLVKLGVFGGLLALGAFNHLWAIRRIRAAAETGPAVRALHALRRSVTLESALAVVIVTTTAVLVSLPMPGA